MNNLASPKIDIDQLEKEMLTFEQADCPVIHRFSNGLYIREVTLPAGIIAIGHHQNFDHLNVMLEGRVSILNDDGTISELIAPMMFTGKAGRKVGYIHEKVVWLNIYPTNEQDIEKLEQTYLTKSDGWTEHKKNMALNKLSKAIDHEDFKKALQEYGFTEEIAWQQSINTSDMTDLPMGSYKIKLSDSDIHGKGLFATSLINHGEVIAPARISGMRTIAGRYTNHSANPNARMYKHSNGDIDLIAIKDITGCKGGQDGEEITIDYRQALSLSIEKVQLCQE